MFYLTIPVDISTINNLTGLLVRDSWWVKELKELILDFIGSFTLSAGLCWWPRPGCLAFLYCKYFRNKMGIVRRIFYTQSCKFKESPYSNRKDNSTIWRSTNYGCHSLIHGMLYGKEEKQTHFLGQDFHHNSTRYRENIKNNKSECKYNLGHVISA